MIDYALWEVIKNGATLPKTKIMEGVMTEMPITTAKEKTQRRLELLEAVEKRFGGNAAIRKTQRNLLKQKYENFTALSSEMLDQNFIPRKLRTTRNKESSRRIGAHWKHLLPQLWCHVMVLVDMTGVIRQRKGLKYASWLSQSSSTDSEFLPSYTENFMPPTPDLSFTGLDEFVNEIVVENCKAMSSDEEPKVVRKYDDALSIEEWVSDDEEKDVSQSKTEKKTVRPSVVKKEFNLVPRAILMKSGLVSVNAARQVNAAHSKTTVNAARLMSYLSKITHSTVKRPIHKNTTFKNSNINQRVNIVRGKNFNTARPKAVVNAGNPQMDLQDQGVIDSECSRHMTWDMSYLTNYEEIDGGYVAFGGNPKGGKIIGKVDERRNRTLIKAARTMLADSKLPTTFWAEAVNTACYVQNRVLVVKPHNKTPYELFHGRTPTLSFMRPFRCPVTILNTIDHLGKFDGKVDEGFFVGYSLNSKAFRVFNSRTRIVEENLHIRFSESTPNVVGSLEDISRLDASKSNTYTLKNASFKKRSTIKLYVPKMHTRASNSELVEPLPEPERTLNRRLRRRNRRVPYSQRNNPPQNPRIVYPPILNINYFRHFLDILQNYDPMDNEPMWAADHVVAPTPGSAITIPEIANEFAIKGNHLTLVKGNQFDGRTKTDPHKHIHEFIGICDMFKYKDTENEAVRLMMFPLSLTREAKTWLGELNEGTIETWDELRTTFISRFFPWLFSTDSLEKFKLFLNMTTNL
ncbi:retrovirus-related pol polyprotein from transposon TNT 1-94 [Tanacetum coccineum]